MQFEYLFICQHSNGTLYSRIASGFRIKDSWHLKQLVEFLEKEYSLEKLNVINYKLVGFNPFKTPGKEKRCKVFKYAIKSWFYDEYCTFNYMMLMLFVWVFPINKHPAAFITILFGWLFIWLTVKMWVKE